MAYAGGGVNYAILSQGMGGGDHDRDGGGRLRGWEPAVHYHQGPLDG